MRECRTSGSVEGAGAALLPLRSSRRIEIPRSAAAYLFALKKPVVWTLTSSTVSETHSGASLPKSCTVALLDEARPAASPTGSESWPLAALFAPLICTDDFPASPPFSLICVMPSDEAWLSL